MRARRHDDAVVVRKAGRKRKSDSQFAEMTRSLEYLSLRSRRRFYKAILGLQLAFPTNAEERHKVVQAATRPSGFLSMSLFLTLAQRAVEDHLDEIRERIAAQQSETQRGAVVT